MEDRPQGGCRQYFSSIHPKPFYRAEFGFKEGGFPVTEFAEFAGSAAHGHRHPAQRHYAFIAVAHEFRQRMLWNRPGRTYHQVCIRVCIRLSTLEQGSHRAA